MLNSSHRGVCAGMQSELARMRQLLKVVDSGDYW